MQFKLKEKSPQEWTITLMIFAHLALSAYNFFVLLGQYVYTIDNGEKITFVIVEMEFNSSEDYYDSDFLLYFSMCVCVLCKQIKI